MRYFILLTLLFLSLAFPAQAAASPIFLHNTHPNSMTFVERSSQEFILDISVTRIEASSVQTPWGGFTRLFLPQFEGRYLKIGEADLPAIHTLIDVPHGAEVEVEVISTETEQVNLTEHGFSQPVMPYQGPIEKTNQALRDHEFQKNQAYYRATRFQELPLVRYEEVGNLRGHRIGQIKIRAVQYLPAQNKLKIYKTIRIRVRFQNADFARTKRIYKLYSSPYFESILKEFLINYRSVRGDLTQYPVHYAIIYYDAFESDLQPFIQWKEQKGFMVTDTSVSAIGNSTSSIKNYIQSLYNGPHPPSFVVLVGDKEQITTYSGQTGSHVTDLYYTTLTAGDYLPDIYIGRLSAQAIPQLTAQLDKILPYEQYQFPQSAFLNHGAFVATDDSWNYTVAEGTHNYVIDTHFTPNNLLADKLYAITYGATGQDVMNAVNNGRFILNYSGHGSTTSWGGPAVSQSMVNASTNTDMYPFVISNACLTGSFELIECFGETWVRKANGGGLAFTGASNSTYWDEDDEWERRAYDGVFWEDYHNLAAFIYRGNLAVLNAGYSRAKYYFEVYHLFGDPSLMLYWGQAPALTVNSASVIFLGSPVFDVQVSGEDSALVSLYMNGRNYGTALTDANGQAQVQFDPVPSTPGQMILTVTKFNRQPFIDTLQVIPASGPYLYCLNPMVNDSNTNNNGIPEAGETISLGFSVTNMGVANASNVQASLSTADTLAQILTGQSSFGTIAPGDTVITGNFLVQLSPDIEHLHSCTFDLHMEDDSGNSWDQTMSLQIRKGAQIEIVNAPLTFPDTYLNFSSTLNLDIKNTGPDTLRISDITPSLPQFAVNPAILQVAPGEQENVSVTFTPESPQVYTADFTVSSNDPIHFQTNFTASGTGIYAPDIALSPDSISRTLDVTDRVTVPIRIENNGLGELIYNAQIAGYPPHSKAPRGSGGADNFGHIWIDSDEAGGPDFQWIDITATGTEIPLTGNNAISDKLNLGFNMPFYGEEYNKFRVCTNGWISFTTYSVAYNNVSLPSPLAPRTMIAPLWDDLNFTTGSKLYFQQEFNKAILLFQNVERVTGEGPYTFEVILYDNGNIVLQYLSLTNLVDDYTVGIQNHLADDGLTVAYNEPYLKDSLAVMISKHSWANVSPMSGMVAPQSADTLLLTLQTSNFPMGEFRATVQVESNDPDEALLYVPVYMVVDTNVVALKNNEITLPDKFSLQQNWPNPFNPSTTITYSLPVAADVELAVFNILGQRVRTLVKGHQAADVYHVRWNGLNRNGSPAASGIYIYQLRAGDKIAMKKMILMR